jgi:F-box and leucine-rich repeat protein 1 (S-phase kinase-associated protein 2)
MWKRVDLGGKKFGPGQAGKIMLRGTKILRMAKAIVQPPLFLDDAEKYHSKHFFVEGISASLCETCVLSNTHGSSMELKLKYLDLSASTIEETCLESLFEKCYNLKKVSLENCKLNDKILYFLAKNKNLEVLNLAMAVGITDCGLTFLAHGLQNTLMDVNFSWIDMNEDMMMEALELLANNSQTLRSLNIAGCKEVLTYDSLHFIIGNCSNIEELDISDAKALTSPCIEMIAGHLKHIRGLSASRCYGIVPLDYLELKNCADLKYLDVFGGMSMQASMELMELLKPVKINQRKYSYIARPTVGTRCTSIWNEKTRYLA